MTSSQQEIPRRGDIFWADLPSGESVGSEQRGRRPVLVLSADIINTYLPICIVVPLSSEIQKANRQHRINILESEKIQESGSSGCPGESIALTEQMRCMSRERLDPKRVAKLKPAALAAVEAGVKYVLNLP